MATDQVKFNMVCDGCVEIAVNVAAGSPTVTVVDTNGSLGTVTAGNSQTFNDYLVNGNSATVSIPDGSTVASGKITGTIKYTVCPTPTPAPPTPSPTIAPTPSPTPASAPLISGGTGGCFGALTNWPSSYGSGNQYTVIFPSDGATQAFQYPSDQYWIFANNPNCQINLAGCDQFVFDFIASGMGMQSGAVNGAFFLGSTPGLTSLSFTVTGAPTYPVTVQMWANT